MQQLTIIKIGGKVLDDQDQLDAVLADFSAIRGRKILVHGGGKKASRLCEQLGIQPRMHAGRRITDAATLEVAVMTYAGVLNKQVVGRLQGLSCNAFGLSGVDGQAIVANKRPVGLVDYGFAGDVEWINEKLIAGLMELDVVPVFCAISADRSGQLLNTNADTIATLLAIALTQQYAVTLKFCFEKAGVLADPDDETSVLATLNSEEYTASTKAGNIYEGMIPKLDNAFAAKNAGVERVLVCGLDGILVDAGTKID
ncbi:acetylglutamate kinase [Lewinellaceae bacterium SD302]|nr:acetylglutamate kinase [Lewinellaceae bacterium SD302]